MENKMKEEEKKKQVQPLNKRINVMHSTEEEDHGPDPLYNLYVNQNARQQQEIGETRVQPTNKIINVMHNMKTEDYGPDPSYSLYVNQNTRQQELGGETSDGRSTTSSTTSTTATCSSIRRQKSFLNIQPIQEDYLGYTVFAALSSVGVCVIDNFLKDDTAKTLQNMVINLSSLQGLLHDPLLHTTGQLSERFRDDYITWLSGKEDGCFSVGHLRNSFHRLVELFLIYSHSQGRYMEITNQSLIQASCFPANSIGYKTHSDNPNNNGRLLTMVYHCNGEYNSQTHGGSSRFYIKNKFADIQPKYNRLVIYWSNALLEILPCKKALYSLTSWNFGYFSTGPNETM